MKTTNQPSRQFPTGLTKSVALSASLLAGAAVTQASTDYSPAVWRAPCNANYYTSGNGHKFCVIHDMEGYYASTISFFASCSHTSSSVYYLVNGKQDTSTDYPAGEVSQMVREANYAWHVCCWNTWMYGTEHEGFAGNPVWYTTAMYDASSDLQRHLCSVAGIAKDRNHIIGHNQWQNAAWKTWMGNNFPSISTTCNTHTDPGVYWDWSRFMTLINGSGASFNPPYMFDTSAESWTAANGFAGPILWTACCGWTGVIYQDQTDVDPYFNGPNCSYAATSDTACINVSVYPQNGDTANHNMQFHWKTAAEDFFDGTKSSPIVNYVAKDNWIRLNLEAGASGKWGGHTITKFRVDFDNQPQNNRFIVGHVINQATPKYTFDTTTEGWTATHGLGTIHQESCCGWPGVIWADQTGTDPNFVSPAFSAWWGGANDTVEVKLYAQNGTNSVHDAQFYWQTTTDSTWTGAKGTGIVNWSGNNQWVTVSFPVGQNSTWNMGQITKLRVDTDNSNTGIRWLIDSVKILH